MTKHEALVKLCECVARLPDGNQCPSSINRAIADARDILRGRYATVNRQQTTAGGPTGHIFRWVDGVSRCIRCGRDMSEQIRNPIAGPCCTEEAGQSDKTDERLPRGGWF